MTARGIGARRETEECHGSAVSVRNRRTRFPSIGPSPVVRPRAASGRLVLTDGRVCVASVDATEGAVQQALHLLCRAGDSLFDRVREVGDHDRLHTRWACLEHASFVGTAAVLVTALVTEMHLDAGQAIPSLCRPSSGRVPKKRP
jgi:hypothetical protein